MTERCLTDLDSKTPDKWDENLQHTDVGSIEAPTSSSRAVWIGVGLLAVIAGAALAFWLRSPAQPAAAPPAKPVVAESKPADPSLPTIPPLDESDSVVADLIRKLSSHPLVAGLLATNGLIRHFAVAISNIADGQAPAALLHPLKPSGPFRVVTRKDGVFIDTRSYARYTPLAEAVDALDPQGVARLYAALKPRLEEAHREAGERNTTFDQTLERAIVSMLKTPVPSGPVQLEPHGVVYIYADPKIEAMTPAQRQLIRMGPDNARTIQTKLRAIALAIGIPSDRLPATPQQ